MTKETRKQKLELMWIGKNNPDSNITNIESRILDERVDFSYGDKNTENMIIFGDNLLALKALLPEYENKIKCIYIDPPYNTGGAFEHYEDSVEHSTWLALMRDRLLLLQNLLTEDGSIWINLDDNEVHYCKVMCDEIFGRSNFVSTVIWQKKYAPKSDSKLFSVSHDFILVVAKNINKFKLGRLQKTEKQTNRYVNRDNDPRGPWKPDNVLRNEVRGYAIFPVKLPSGREVMPPAGTSWRYTKEKFAELITDKRVWFGVDGDGRPAIKRFISEVSSTIPATTIWLHEEVGHNDESKKESKVLFGDQLFGTPKPERLLERVISLATNPNDIVLDSFLGSGTTTAVAHKMKRKYIGIEVEKHAFTHVYPRMKKVVDGNDKLKLSEVLKWKGGGGFKFYVLAPSFIIIDEFGNPVIDPYYDDTKLIRAMCKLTNYIFSPSPTEYWKQGKGQGNNHIYITTQMLSVAMVQQIAQHLKPNEFLLICPKKFEHGCEKIDSRITVKKIPQSILNACQFGKKEYLLPIKDEPIEEIEEEEIVDD